MLTQPSIRLTQKSILACILLVLAFLLAPTPSTESARSAVAVVHQTYDWHTFYGSSTNDEYGYAVAVDASGNIYIAGLSNGSWQGDGNIAPKHPYAGNGDAFIMKLDKNGVYQWHTFYGSSGYYDTASGIALDASGNVYVSGSSNDLWLGDGDAPPRHDDPGGVHAWILNLDTNGVYQWHTFFGGSTSNDYAAGVAMDGSGNLYIAGSSSDTWTWDGSTPPKHPYAGSRELYILKLNSSGAYQWHTFYGSSDLDWGYGIAVYGNDNVYAVAVSNSTWQGDGNASPKHSHSSSGTAYDMAVVKVNGSGTYQWHTFYGSGGSDQSEGIATDGSGLVYVSGYSDASWQGDGNTDPKHAYSGGKDGTLLKLDSSGTYQWHLFWGTTGDDYGYGVTTSASGALYLAGASDGTWQGPGGAEPLHPHSSGTNLDLVAMQLDSGGAYQWHTFYGSTDEDRGIGIAVGGVGALHVVGSSKTTWLGDGGTAPRHSHSSSGTFFDMVALKLRGPALYLPLILR